MSNDLARPRRLSTPCPCCQRRIGIWAGIKAPTPLTIRCPHCHTWLRVRMRGLVPLTAGVIALLLVCVKGFVWVQAAQGGWRVGAYALLMLAAWLALEIGTCVHLFTHATFTPINKARRRQTL